ncbi:MAG: shikimate kinase [candidate division KSB1 bacterium]|nr:shikimate kinase [candidate division KSB1 bacterium]
MSSTVPSLIYLTGFMASGKTTVGFALAQALHRDFFDLDLEIEARLGKRIADIFQQEGGAFFREIEKTVLAELSQKENAVIALGGGTLLEDENLEVVKKRGVTICLFSTPEEIWKRIVDSDKRQLIAGPDRSGRILTNDHQIYRRIESLMLIRKSGYEESDIMIDSTHKTVPQIVQEILLFLESYRREHVISAAATVAAPDHSTGR